MSDTVNVEVSTSVEEAVRANANPDQLKRKLDYFQYKADPHAKNIWEFGGEEVSPMHVPEGIRVKYPNLRFHWSSKRVWDVKGHNYGGWQRFSDGDYPDGVTRGNDLFLSCMPEEQARNRQQYYENKSSEMIRSVQEKSIASIDEVEALGGQAIVDGKPATGIVIPERAKVGMNTARGPLRGGGGNRGISPQEMAETLRKQKEQRARGRIYSR